MPLGKVDLLFDSISPNTGDIAIGIALQQLLEAEGIECNVLDPYNSIKRKSPLIIVGGGQLLRNPGDDFYDLFRVEGPHILNGIGVDATLGLDYLNSYSYLSARSTLEAAKIKKFTKKSVHIIPDLTTGLVSQKYIIEGIKEDEKLVGIHLVPDTLRMCPELIETINNIPYKKVLIPFTHYNCDKSFMDSLPIDRTNVVSLPVLKPLELYSAIGQMSSVIVSSLHASIFAYSQNVPFASMFQEKVYNYFNDRGLGSNVFRTQTELDRVIELNDSTKIDYTKLINADKRLIKTTIAEYLKIIIQNTKEPIRREQSIRDLKSEMKAKDLNIKHLTKVVEGRDLLIHDLVTGAHKEKATIIKLNSELNDRKQDLKKLKEKVDSINSRIREIEEDSLWKSYQKISSKMNKLKSWSK